MIGFLVALAWTTLPRPQHLRTGERLAAVLVYGVIVLVGAGWVALTLIPST